MSDFEYVYYTVITTNAGNLEARLPDDERFWTAEDQRQWDRLKAHAEACQTYVRSQCYSLLGDS